MSRIFTRLIGLVKRDPKVNLNDEQDQTGQIRSKVTQNNGD